MEKIIRRNTVETSSQKSSLEKQLYDVYPYCNLVSRMASIYSGTVTSIRATLIKITINTETAIAAIFQIATKKRIVRYQHQ